jgi:signal peptidase I
MSDATPGTPAGATATVPTKAKRSRSSAASWVVTVAIAVVVAVVVRTFLFQMFWIPSESMSPTLEKGDRVIVNKFGDVSNPSRGDVLVFSRPPALSSAEDHLIKRVIGLPGDRVAFVDGKVFIDEQPLDEPYLVPGTQTLDLSAPGCALAAPCVVGANQLWMMGDNRDHSADSRRFGPIERETVVGRAFVTVWPFSRFGGL